MNQIQATLAKQSFTMSPLLPSDCFDDNIEPILRLQEHLVPASDDCLQGTNAPAPTSEWTGESSSCVRALKGAELEHCGRSSATGDGEIRFIEKPAPSELDSSSLLLDNSGGLLEQEGYNAKVDEPFSDQFGDGITNGFDMNDFSSEAPQDAGYDDQAPTYVYETLGGHCASPVVDLGLSLSPDEPFYGSATSLQSPEFPPYEYAQGTTTGGSILDYSMLTPHVVSASTRTEEYDEGRFPTFQGMHNGYHSESGFSSDIGKLGKTPELNTWQQAALTSAYADASKAAAIRALVEASYYPQSPDLYDSSGRSLTGGGNLEFDPVYGLYRNAPSSQASSPLARTPNLALLLSSPTFASPKPNERLPKVRRTLKRPSSPILETKMLPRPSFAASNNAGGNFMMVNLRAKKGGHRRSNGTGVGKRSTKPKPLNDQSDMWRYESATN